MQVIAWTMNSDYTAATRVADPLVGGIPAGSIHDGCRLRFGPHGFLWIATGDAASGTVPQDLTSLGGKVLRVDASTGAGAPGNPFAPVAARLHPRPSQPAGPRAPPRHEPDVVGRARADGGRRDQPADLGGQLRLGSDTRLRPVRSHDRPREVPRRGRGPVVVRRPDAGDQRRHLPPRRRLGGVGRPARGRHAQDPVAPNLQVHRGRDVREPGGRARTRRYVRAPPDPHAGPRGRALPHHIERRRRGPHPQGRPRTAAGVRRRHGDPGGSREQQHVGGRRHRHRHRPGRRTAHLRARRG